MTLDLTLTDSQDVNLIGKYGIEMCRMKHLPLSIIVLACIYNSCIFMTSNQYDVIEFVSPLL